MDVKALAQRALRDVRRDPSYQHLINNRHAAAPGEFDGLVRQAIDRMNLDPATATQVAATINPRLAR